jgi:hypothetical protein
MGRRFVLCMGRCRVNVDLRHWLIVSGGTRAAKEPVVVAVKIAQVCDGDPPDKMATDYACYETSKDRADPIDPPTLPLPSHLADRCA